MKKKERKTRTHEGKNKYSTYWMFSRSIKFYRFAHTSKWIGWWSAAFSTMVLPQHYEIWVNGGFCWFFNLKIFIYYYTLSIREMANRIRIEFETKRTWLVWRKINVYARERATQMTISITSDFLCMRLESSAWEHSENVTLVSHISHHVLMYSYTSEAKKYTQFNSERLPRPPEIIISVSIPIENS